MANKVGAFYATVVA